MAAPWGETGPMKHQRLWVDGALEAADIQSADLAGRLMEKECSWASIFALPTLITGFLGQNLAIIGFRTARCESAGPCVDSVVPLIEEKGMTTW